MVITKTNTNKNAYVYIHTRLDTNEVFYVGIGIAKNNKRAFSKRNRNLWWRNIINKTSYKVDIVKENITSKEAKTVEISLIKKYGRRDLKQGSLVNMTDGGDGVFNLSQYSRNQISIKNTGKIGLAGAENPMFGKVGALNPMFGTLHSTATRSKISKGVLKYNETSKNGMLGRKHTKTTKDKISAKNKGRFKGPKSVLYGISFTEEHKLRMRGKRPCISKGNHRNASIVLNIESGIFYLCIKEVSEVFNINYSTLRTKLRNNQHNLLKTV